MKTNTWLIAGVVAAILIGAIFYFRDSLIKFFKPKADPSSPDTDVKNTSAKIFPLKKGSVGNEVESVQKYLNSIMIQPPLGMQSIMRTNLSTDGKFGQNTEAAVKRYISATGTVTEDYYNKNVKPFINQTVFGGGGNFKSAATGSWTT